ncbi:MAG: tetratricopeptide repeat protein [Myxococcota bacterium]
MTSGLYGGGSVPTIRDSDEPRPRAAAIQLSPTGGARVLGLEEEEEPIEIGEAEGYDDEDVDFGDGFSVRLEEDEESYADYDEEDEDLSAEDLEVIQPAGPPPGPSPEEIAALLERARRHVAGGGDLQEAAELYSDAIDADPNNATSHVARGRLYLDLGDYSRAMSDFIIAEGLASDDPEPQVAIGDLYFARKDYRKAIDCFNAALEMAPNHAMAFCRRGISHYYRKNYREAVDDLLRAERLDADIPNIQTFVSMARKKVRR